MDDQEPTDAGPYWKSAAADALAWESWGDQHAVFDSRSGETHLLPDSTAQLLRRLGEGPCTAVNLAQSLCAQSQAACDDRYVEQIGELLRQLQAMGLVENTPA